MKKIAILTRDCAGINAAIRAIVRTAKQFNVEIIGIMRGFNGLMDGEIIKLDDRFVSGIINIGGTILKTSRADRFLTKKGQELAIKTIKENNIDGLIVIGGNGSLTGAHILATKYNIPVVGLPATIDNDLNEIDLAIGTDTAVNVALDALDKIRDTAKSLERIFIVEVMGRNCGYIALNVALAGGCEEVLVPEKEIDIEKMCKEIQVGNIKGKISWIIIVAEGRAKAQDIADIITSKTNLETRVAVLGHIQRGGRPVATDRLLACRLGNFAIKSILDGVTDHCVNLKNGELEILPLQIVIQPKKIEVEKYYRLIKILT